MISFYSRSTKFSTKKAPQDHNKRRVMSFRSSTSRRFRATSGNEWFGGRCPDRRTGKPGFLPPGNSWVSIAVLFCLNREKKKTGQLWHGFWMEYGFNEVNNNFGWQNGGVKRIFAPKKSPKVLVFFARMKVFASVVYSSKVWWWIWKMTPSPCHV